MDSGWIINENGGFSKKMKKNEKKIEKKIQKKYHKNFLCHFLIPGENLREKKIFLARILTVIFRPVLAQKILMHFQRGGFGRKINEK